MRKLTGVVVLFVLGSMTIVLFANQLLRVVSLRTAAADDASPTVAVTTDPPSLPVDAHTNAKQTASLDGSRVNLSVDVPQVHPDLVDCYANLERAIVELKKVSGYTARWVRQIRKYGSLRDEEHVDIKIRHEPFGVHMNWLDGSQQVLFVEGQSDDRLLAHKARGFASLRPVWRLPPESRLAMKDSRYPVTQLGMLRLAERLKRIVAAFPVDGEVDAEITSSEFEGRPCIRQFVKFGSPTDQPEYALSDLLIDQSTYALVSITNHGWTDGGVGNELIEHYRYENIDWQARLTDSDFDEHNEAYPFSH